VCPFRGPSPARLSDWREVMCAISTTPASWLREPLSPAVTGSCFSGWKVWGSGGDERQ
jgi:hypothetical protein